MARDLRVGLALILAWTGCGAQQRTRERAEPQASEEARWDALSQRYLEQSFARDPGFAVMQGRHERDGEIVDLSQQAVAAWVAELHGFRREAEALEAAALDQARRFEREYLLSNVDAGLFMNERLKEHERNPFVYANAVDPSVYLTRAYAPLERRLTAYLRHARNIPRTVDQMLANLRTPLPRSFVEVGLSVFAGLAPYLERDVPPIFAGVRDPGLQAELAAASAQAVAAVRKAVAWLEGQKPSANEAFALGPELFRELLWATERVDAPLSELRAAGLRDLERNEAALREACAQLAPKRSLADCAALVGDDKPKAGPVQAAREQLTLLKGFVAEREFVSIPGPEEARVEEAPPYKRWNQAYIEIPGPYESGLPSIYYIAPPDPAWSAAEQRAYVPGQMDLLFISVHEVWPGHFLQFLHANRVARPFGRVFVGYAFAEGWAHYAEELAWDEGLARDDPKARVGQLLNALLRNVRYVSALGLHTEGMRVAESEQLFRERALCDPGNARQQAARGTFDPAYLNYTLGKLMIRKLREDWTGTRGGRAAYREFHDRLLSFGGPPLPLVREALLGDRAHAL